MHGRQLFISVVLCSALLLPSSKSLGQERVTLALQWLTQCQFAGYYAALENGYYAQEGIDLVILPGATDINPISLVTSENADFGTKWLADLIAVQDKGLPLISLAQVVQSNGLVMLAKRQSGIETPWDFTGKKIGIWFFGNQVQFLALMHKLDIPLTSMSVAEQTWSLQPFLRGQLDVIMAMRYNEYLRILDSGYHQKDLNIIDFAQYGLNFPGQVIFTTTALLQKHPDLCQRMIRASLKGWSWAMLHPRQAVDIVLKHDQTKSLHRERQIRQMQVITQLIRYGRRPLGYHSPSQVRFVMKSLAQNKVISRPMEPSRIYTNQIWREAQSRKHEE